MAKDPKKPTPGTPIIEKIFGPKTKVVTKYTPPTKAQIAQNQLIADTYAAYQDALAEHTAAKKEYDAAEAAAQIWPMSNYFPKVKSKSVDKVAHVFKVYYNNPMELPLAYVVNDGDPVYIWGSNTPYDGRYYVDVSGMSHYDYIQIKKDSADSTSEFKPLSGYIGMGGTGDGWYARTFSAWTRLKTAEKVLKTTKADWTTAKAGKVPTGYTLNGSNPETPADFPNPTTPTTYNIPSVTSSYFRSDEYYSKNVLLSPGGKPLPVTRAEELWGNPNTSHKGMIQVWKYNTLMSSAEASNSGESNWLTGNQLYPTKKRYGFQFMYNPGSITQVWSGLPSINVSYVMSGKDKTPYVAPIDTSSTISFAIPINRVNDMALLAEKGVANVAANSNTYYGQKVDQSELQIIRNRGTMYDVEYLLKTLVGFEIYSELRGYKTADIGWLLGYAIELHLGKDLRYIGTISYVEVQHTIFNSEMVPVYSTLNLSVTRRVEPVVTSKTTGAK